MKSLVEIEDPNLVDWHSIVRVLQFSNVVFAIDLRILVDIYSIVWRTFDERVHLVETKVKNKTTMIFKSFSLKINLFFLGLLGFDCFS